MNGSPRRWTWILATFMVISALLIQLVIPQFGFVYHTHAGSGKFHFHPEWQSGLAAVPIYDDHSGDHSHPHRIHNHPHETNDPANPPVLLILDDTRDQGHGHSYDHFIGKFFAHGAPFLTDHPFYPFEEVHKDRHTLTHWISRNSRAPPSLPSSTVL